ncbi:5665_t:CDS:1 [Ambispora gerdemannii]|uniref:5665_t:CDS:1 n=1 Tax=Ambispora gerdemannii TaxID=144530 RepID=A0A9N9C530_9GLOM|nr:5665_t:CDS:1 [Ambispora gerdemannii]
MKKGLFILFLVIAFALAVVASPGLSKRGKKQKKPKPGKPSQPPSSSDADFAKDSLSGAANGHVCDVSKIKTKANGTQLKNGGRSCSDTQIGEIPDVSQMVSSLITTPENGQVLKANTPFTVSVISANLATGNFDDPETEYYKFSQQLNKKGFIKGHTHITVQRLISTKSAPDARDPIFFKGLNNITKESTLSVEVTPGLIPGIYRICTMTASFAHQPLIMPVAKRGAQDDCIRVKTA